MTHIRTETSGAVGVIAIDRRERFNSFDVETARDFRKAGLAFARDESLRAVVIKGAGDEHVGLVGCDKRESLPIVVGPSREVGALRASHRGKTRDGI
jgi:hypothetical protein